jgi:hypothetical protein
MSSSGIHINFNTPAILRKWPSLNNERISASLGARAYLVVDGSLDECIRQFLAKPPSQRHLYEIHTAAQTDLVSAILSVEDIVEIARLRDFLYWLVVLIGFVTRVGSALTHRAAAHRLHAAMWYNSGGTSRE